MNLIITAVCLSLASVSPLAYADEKDGIPAELMDLRTPHTEQAPKKQPVPEPNILVALAFAGVVILTRHRFRA